MKSGIQFALRGYKRWISPLLPNACRFVPTCSEYAIEAVERHGALHGSWLAVMRVLRCHPLARAGYDPVPSEICSLPSLAGIDGACLVNGCGHQDSRPTGARR